MPAICYSLIIIYVNWCWKWAYSHSFCFCFISSFFCWKDLFFCKWFIYPFNQRYLISSMNEWTDVFELLKIGWVRTEMMQKKWKCKKSFTTTKLIDRNRIESRAGSFFLHTQKVQTTRNKSNKKGLQTYIEKKRNEKNIIWLIWIWIRLSLNAMMMVVEKNWTCFFYVHQKRIDWLRKKCPKGNYYDYYEMTDVTGECVIVDQQLYNSLEMHACFKSKSQTKFGLIGYIQYWMRNFFGKKFSRNIMIKVLANKLPKRLIDWCCFFLPEKNLPEIFWKETKNMKQKWKIMIVQTNNLINECMQKQQQNQLLFMVWWWCDLRSSLPWSNGILICFLFFPKKW